MFGEAYLRRILGKYAAYYTIHRSLDKDAPFHRTNDGIAAIDLNAMAPKNY